MADADNMSAQPVVRPMTTPQDIEMTFPIMRQLRPHLTSESYADCVTRMMSAGFHLAAAVNSAHVVAVAGYRMFETLAWGPLLYVDDLVTDENARSRGYGKLMLEWLKMQARARGCAELHLDSGVQRHGAHRFYLRERLDISAYHFKISLS